MFDHITDTYDSDYADDDVVLDNAFDALDDVFVAVDVAFALRTWQRDHATID